MEIKNYAPVTMTTLCRYEHFRRCLESLEKCTGAECTDVYVALDYPANESHEEGWKKIDAYLKEKEKNNGFRSLNVRRRDHNCGVGKPGSNGDLLFQEIKMVTDRFISFEDDNEFSPCFLQYVNKALEKYEDDDRVISVCGYTPIELDKKENIYFARNENAWGHGVWIRKKAIVDQFVNLESYEKVLHSFSASLRLFWIHPTSLYVLLDNVIIRKVHGDVGNVAYCMLNNSYSVFPTRTLVRNWGNDGTGVHSKVVTKYDKKEISNAKTFELDDVEVKERKDVRRLLVGMTNKHWYGNLAILIRYLVWRTTKKDVFVILKKCGLMYNE